LHADSSTRNGQHATGFEHRDHDDLTINFSTTRSGLRRGDGLERGIIDGLYETISEGIQGRPERLDFILVKDMFLN
jgi:hypothetical protein